MRPTFLPPNRKLEKTERTRCTTSVFSVRFNALKTGLESPIFFFLRQIPSMGTLTVEKETTGCNGTPNYIRYLEHVEVVISLKFTRRGDLVIYVTSPQGTRSTLLGKRKLDYNSHDGFNKWVFMSTHTWEENPHGKWKIEIENVGK